MRHLAALVVTAAVALPASAQFTPLSWNRSSEAHVFSQDFVFDGGATSASDSFSNPHAALGSWSSDDTASASHGSIGNVVHTTQTSDISATSLTSSGSMNLAHSRPPSLSSARSSGHMQYSASVSLAAPTTVSIDFGFTSTVGSTGFINNHQCLFSVTSSTPFSVLAGEWAGSPLPGSYSFLGVLGAGNYTFSMDVLVDETAEGNNRRALSWQYDWHMDVHAVPAPTSAGLMGMALLAAPRRRR